MIKKYLSIFILLVFLSGCATYANGPAFTQAPTPPEKKSTFYIFRAKAKWGSSANNPMVKIDGKSFVKLTTLGYSYAYLSPGIHKLTFNNGGAWDNFITEIRVKEGEDLFIEYIDYGNQSLRTLSKAKALEEAQNYKFVEPINTNF